MKIIVTWGTGEGPTKLAAFDSALMSAGIANYNLIKLSSIIPPGSRVVVKKFKAGREEFGNKLYVVLSERIETRNGFFAVAGLGWIQAKDGRGLLVEHWGESKTEVRELIKKSLLHMASERGWKCGRIRNKIASIKCKGLPVCAVVAAVFVSENWMRVQ